MDSVFIEGLRIDTVIGIHAWERAAPQPVVLSVTLACAPAAGDGIAGTIDYAAVVEALRTFVGARTDQLLETLADACAAMLKQAFPQARAIELQVDKPVAARNLGCGRVGVRIRRDYA